MLACVKWLKRRKNEVWAGAGVYVVVVYGCRRFVVLLHNTLSLTQTVPVPGRAAASAGKAKMMDDDDDGTCKLG